MHAVDELCEAIPHLRRWAVRFETRHADADSMVSDTVIRFLENQRRYDPKRGSLRKFLFSSLKNMALDAIRKSRRNYRKECVDYLHQKARVALTVARDDWMTKEEIRERFERHISEMPTTLATVFRLHALHGKSYGDVSRELGMSVGAVKVAVCRARVRVRKCWKSCA